MGFIDKIKAIFGGGPGAKVDKVVNASKSVVTANAQGKLAGMAEDAAKDALAGIAADVVNDQIDKVLTGLPKGPMRDRIVEKAIDKVVDKVWEESKDKLLGGGE